VWDIDETISRLQVLPSNGIPVDNQRYWGTDDLAWENVARGISVSLKLLKDNSNPTGRRVVLLQQQFIDDDDNININGEINEDDPKVRQTEPIKKSKTNFTFLIKSIIGLFLVIFVIFAYKNNFGNMLTQLGNNMHPDNPINQSPNNTDSLTIENINISGSISADSSKNKKQISPETAKTDSLKIRNLAISLLNKGNYHGAMKKYKELLLNEHVDPADSQIKFFETAIKMYYDTLGNRKLYDAGVFGNEMMVVYDMTTDKTSYVDKFGEKLKAEFDGGDPFGHDPKYKNFARVHCLKKKEKIYFYIDKNGKCKAGCDILIRKMGCDRLVRCKCDK
jgi:hypothetical protein